MRLRHGCFEAVAGVQDRLNEILILCLSKISYNFASIAAFRQLSPWIRGGYGISSYLQATGANLRLTQNPPFHTDFEQTAVNPSTAGAYSPGVYYQASNRFPTSVVPTTTFYVWPKNLKPAMTQDVSLTTESAAAPASVADSLAAPNTLAFSELSCAPDRTPGPLPAGRSPPRELSVVPLHTVPLCTCLRCPTETHHLNRRRTLFVTPWSFACPWNQNAAGGLLLLRHVTPRPRRDVVYFHSGAHIRVIDPSQMAKEVLLRDELIARTMHRSEIPRFRRVLFQLLAQFQDLVVDCSCSRITVISPNFIQKLLST